MGGKASHHGGWLGRADATDKTTDKLVREGQTQELCLLELNGI